MVEKVCPICKSIFIPTYQWVFVRGARGARSNEIYFCRYSCMKAYDKWKKTRPSGVEKRMKANREQIEKYMDEGLSPSKIASLMGISGSSAKRYIEQIEIDRDGKTKKEVKP